MAKSQKHGNRETRKPKTAKAKVAVPVATFLTKGALSPIAATPKKK